MRQVEVEIYSDASILAVIRHPGRQFPGSLIQGDSLHILCSRIDEAMRALDANDLEEARGCMMEVSDSLHGRLAHYKEILSEHGIGLPFYEKPAE